MPIYKITTDEVAKAKDEIKNKISILGELSKKTPIEALSSDLKKLS